MQTAKSKREIATQHTRNYRARHPQRVKESRAKIYVKRKRRTFELLGGAICASCGCNELAFLEINHVDGGGSKEWRSRRASLHDDILSGKRSVEDLNVLCRVCNAIDFLNRKNPNATGRFVARWEQYTGQKAELTNGELTPAPKPKKTKVKRKAKRGKAKG